MYYSPKGKTAYLEEKRATTLGLNPNYRIEFIYRRKPLKIKCFEWLQINYLMFLLFYDLIIML